MGFFFGILLGLVVGAAVIYFLLSRQVAEQGAAMQTLRQQLTQADVERDRRIKAATESLRQSYETQLSEAQTETAAVQQKLATTEAERDRLKYDYDTNVRAVQADAARQVQQKLSEAEANYNQRLQAERDRLQQEYEAQLTAAQPYAPPSVASPSVAPLMPTIPAALEAPESGDTLPLAENTQTATSAMLSPVSDETAATLMMPTVPAVSEPAQLDSSAIASTSIPEAAALPVSPTAVSDAPRPTPTASQLQATSPPGSNHANVAARSVNALTQNASALVVDSYAPDATVRHQVATAIATAMPSTTATEQARWLPTLKRLIRDRDPSVRLQAIQALSHAKKASQSLPLLRRALRDANPFVVKAASTAMTRFKGYAPHPQPNPSKPRLPKNR
ncbi:MAG: HEAT repeat domain-containing protein [Leptolyngbyaceae cyanobacterium]